MHPPRIEAPAATPPPRSLPARLWERALDLVYPRRCVACDSFGAFICTRCLATTSRAEPPRCPRCWMPVQTRNTERECSRCRARLPAFGAVRSVFVYEDAARDAVLALKFRGVSALAPEMAALMAQLLLDWAPPVQVIAPVPLAGHRRRQRGYNQAELLAGEVSRIVGLPVVRHALLKRRATPPQARQPGEEERRRNVAGAFVAGRQSPTGGLLLIDDVITTGATLDACARVLLDGGGGPVFALTFARED